MSTEELPKWLQEIGRSPRPQSAGRPVPAIPHGMKREPELDEHAAAKLERDYRFVIESCSQEEEQQLNAKMLDAMTANRLSSKQALQLLRSLFAKFDGGIGMCRIDAEGNPQPLNRWGAA